MSKAVAIVRTASVHAAERARLIVVLACAAALTLAERGLPLL